MAAIDTEEYNFLTEYLGWSEPSEQSSGKDAQQ